MAGRPARRSTKSESDSRHYAEQIFRDANELAIAARSLAHLIDRVPIGSSLGKRLGPKIRGVRGLVQLAQQELHAARLEHLAALDPLSQDGSGAELAKAIAEQAERCSLTRRYVEPGLAKMMGGPPPKSLLDLAPR